MRFLRALAILLAAVFAAALLAAWFVPQHLDWDRYRDQLTRLAASALDRPVLIEGPIRLRLLPQPVLTAADVRIAGEPDQGSLSAGELSLRIGLGPLLRGRLDARELVLRRVDLTLPWPLPEGALPIRQPTWLAGLSARIEGGRVAFGKLHIGHVTAGLIAGLSGGYTLSGTGEVDGRMWRLAASLGAPGLDNAAPLSLTLDGLGSGLQGTEASFAGEISPGGLGGHVSAHGPDLSQLVPAPKLAFSADGRLTVASGLAAADNLTLLIGGAPAHGAISLRTTPTLRLDLALTASRLDLDAWLPVMLRAHPLAYPVGIDLSADAAPLAGGLVQQLRATAEIAGGAVALRDVTAILPGEAALRLSGRIVQGQAEAARDPPSFAGKVALTAPDLRATLHWLDPTGARGLQALPPGVLRSLDLSAAVGLDAERLALLNLAGTVDASRIGGDVMLGLGFLRGKPALLQAKLSTDRLDLDAWLAAAQPSHTALVRLLPTLGAGRLDTDLQLHVDHAAIDGVALSDLMFDGDTKGGRLTIRHFEVRGLGLQANASGGLDPSGRMRHLRFVLTGKDATPIGEWLAPVWRASPAFWHAPVLAFVEADGPAGAVAVNGRVLLANTELGVEGRLALASVGGPVRAAASFSLDNPAADSLLRQAGFPDLAAAFGPGPLVARLRLGLTPESIGLGGIALAAGELRVSGALTVDRSGKMPNVIGHLDADALPLPPFALRSPAPLPFEALRGWQAQVALAARSVLEGAARMPLMEQASATLSVSDGKFSLQNVRAKLLGGSLTGTIALQAASEPPLLTLNAKLSAVKLPGSLTGLPVDVQGGEAEGTLALTAVGHSPATLLATLNGQIRATVRNGELKGLDLGAVDDALRNAPSTPDESHLDAALKSALGSGQTAFDQLDLTATANRGILQLGRSELSGPAGGAALSGSIDLPDASLDLHGAIRPALPSAPLIGLTIAGPADAPGRLADLADVTRWRNQVARAP